MEYLSLPAATCALRRRAVMAVVIVAAAGYLLLVGGNSVDVAQSGGPQLCAPDAPPDPAKYYSYAEKVMAVLVKKTPTSSTRKFRTSRPDKRIGSVAGAATCYTNKAKKCRACLRGIKALLESCKGSTTAGYFASDCNMQFWRIDD
ncbi:unnamed protein product [Linum trigynum]|uniref:Gnk2-homologous domain-containing protein n=1 Tax=Linum trigynum TaxID=586398 RepID=A0AAV2CM36_9ROSI